MAASTALIAALIILTATLAAAQSTVRVCIPDSFINTAACSALFNMYAARAGLTTQFQCQAGGSPTACTQAVASGTAELTKFGGDSLYVAHTEFKLVAVLAEELKPAAGTLPANALKTASYASVAVVRAADCAANPQMTLADFQGKNMCSTGYRRTAGWTLPFGFMVGSGIIPVVGSDGAVEQDAESVAEFFGKVCSVGVGANGGPQTGSDGKAATWAPMCEACKSPVCPAPGNEETEEYSDYVGTLKGLAADACDIAFTKHDTVLGPSTAWSTTQTQNDLRLVCPDGGCKPVADWATCHLAVGPSHAFVSTNTWAQSATGQAVIQFLSGVNSTFVADTRLIEPSKPNLVFTSSAEKLVVLDPSNFQAHFSPSAMTAYSGIRQLDVPVARICASSPAEKVTCDKVLPTMNQANTGVQFECVEADGDTGCLNAIQTGIADFKAFDGQDIYNGYKDHNLKAIVAEKNPNSETVLGVDYYAVAVVKKSWCHATNGGKPTFMDLKGKRACSTGYRRSAGWSFPVGTLIKEGVMPVVRNAANIEDDAESWTSFFGSSCAARTSDNGPVNTPDGRGAPLPALCTACAGECVPDVNREPYYDYTGAFRGIVEDKCDVAFTKHSIALDFSADGKTPNATWSKVPSSDLALLCRTGGCVPLSQASRCNIARAVAHAVMVRSDYADTARLKGALIRLGRDEPFRQLLFSGQANPNNHIFKYTTTELVPVDDDTRSYLGTTYDAYQGLDTLDAGAELPGTGPLQAAGSSARGGGSSKELAPGAVAGIAVGAAIGGALLALVAYIAISRRRNPTFQTFRDPSSPDSAVGATKGANF